MGREWAQYPLLYKALTQKTDNFPPSAFSRGVYLAMHKVSNMATSSSLAAVHARVRPPNGYKTSGLSSQVMSGYSI